jgi:hypothetical protein
MIRFSGFRDTVAHPLWRRGQHNCQSEIDKDTLRLMWDGARRTLILQMLFTCWAFAFHLQFVGNREDSRDATCAHKSDIPVSIAIDDAIKRDIAMLNRDSNRLPGVDGVLVQRRVTVDGTCCFHTNAVVHRRNGINLDFVDHIPNSRYVTRG